MLLTELRRCVLGSCGLLALWSVEVIEGQHSDYCAEPYLDQEREQQVELSASLSTGVLVLQPTQKQG